MIDDDDREGMIMDTDIITALAERAQAREEHWRFHGTLLILVDMLKRDGGETEDETQFQWIREVLSTVLTLMLYLDKMPTEDEIEVDVAKFREMLDRANGDKPDNNEEEPLS